MHSQASPLVHTTFVYLLSTHRRDRTFVSSLLLSSTPSQPPRTPSAARMSSPSVRPPLPPYTAEAAAIKVRAAEDAWNSRNPELVSLAYTPDSKWRNRSQFINGRPAIVAFLADKWSREHEYRLIKQLWSCTDNRIAVRFAYEWHDEAGQWWRSYGNENWQFDANGLMEQRHASINDVKIDEQQRQFRWQTPTRPAEHASLSELGL